MPSDREQMTDELFNDIIGDESTVDSSIDRDDLHQTITNILHDYNLSTDLSFVEKIATMKFPATKGGAVDIAKLPQELKDAAFLPVNTIADIAIRQDIDLIISQIPEWYTALQVTRDAICEADVVNGRLARNIIFDHTKLSDEERETIMKKIEDVEDRLRLHQIIKNHMVFDTLQYGEGYIYCIPYAKVFEDLYKYRLNAADRNKKESVSNMFETSSILNGYGYHESGLVEISLNDTIINESNTDTKSKKKSKKEKNLIFTESEIIEVNPMYSAKSFDENGKEDVNAQKEYQEEYDAVLDDIAHNISYIREDIALPVIEESAHDLKAVYETKYRDLEEQGYVQEVSTFFEQVMNDGETIESRFSGVKGVYMKILPATKLIPIRIDRCVVGYYYISDMTKTEQNGQRHNSGLSGYTLRTPSVGYDTFSPDQMFCEKLANKIINNFDLKFMRDNTALHQQIVAILQSHRFNESMMRFIFIPAEYVIQGTIAEDGDGKGHSMLEPGLVTARMYMFLKLYSLLYQINNSAVRVYNLNMSGMDKNYEQYVQNTMRKFTARRITANDIFNYRSSMTKVSGGSELVMPMGAGGKPPITFDKIDAESSPLNNDLLDNMKTEAINATPVPSAIVLGAMSERDFAKEVESDNARFHTMTASYKIDLNHPVTQMYRKVLRWETDIPPEVLNDLKFAFRQAEAKQLSVTSDMVSNFNNIVDLTMPIFLTKEEIGKEDTDTAREFKKLMLIELFPAIDVDRFSALANQAREKANELSYEEANKSKNMMNEEDEEV